MKNIAKKLIVGLSLTVGLVSGVQAETKVVLLGTGTPVPDYKHASAGTAVVYNGKAYVFDAGTGVVQNMIEAAQRLGIKALLPINVNNFFLTHFHSDHYLDFPSLLGNYWWRRTSGKINAYGPTGMKNMYAGYKQFLEEDTRERLAGNQPIKHKDYWEANIFEYEKGADLVVKDGDVTIRAFDVPHGDLKHAFGYVITTPDKKIIISGDTTYSPKLIEEAKGADIVVHEVACEEGLSKIPEFWQAYHARHHTTTSQIADVANKVQPKTFVLTHVLSYKAPREKTLEEVKAKYKGNVVLGNDLDVFE